MSAVMAKVLVQKAGRTYSARIGSRDGAIIRSVIARQTVGVDYDGTRAPWSDATVQFTDIIDGLYATNTHTERLENKIAYQKPVNKASFLYSVRIGSRNGAVISNVTARQRSEVDNV